MDDLKRLIDADPVYEDLRKSYEELKSIRDTLTQHEDIQICNAQLITFQEALIRIKDAPTVDAVEVVRCKDCKHYNKREIRCDHPCLDWEVECYDHWLDVALDDFCSYGERREGE